MSASTGQDNISSGNAVTCVMYSVMTLQSEPRKLCCCLIAQVMKRPKRVAAPSLNICERGENLTGRGRAHSNCPVVPADQDASGFVIQSSFYALLLSPFCRLAADLFYGHLWIGSQLIYSQRVTGETSDVLFRFAANNNSSNDGSLLLFASPSPLRVTCLQSQTTRKTESHVLQGNFWSAHIASVACSPLCVVKHKKLKQKALLDKI